MVRKFPASGRELRRGGFAVPEHFKSKAAGTQKERHLLKADQFGRKDVYDLSGNNYVCGYNLPGAGTLIGIIPAFSSVGTLRPFVGSDLH